MPILRSFRRLLFNTWRPWIFPELGAESLASILPQADPDKSVEMWEYFFELALRYHYNHFFRLTLSTAFRVRPNQGIVEFNHSQELGAPPPSAVSINGRLNEKGQSRFYAAADPLAALLEVRPKVGDILTLTMFALRNYSQATRQRAIMVGMSKYSSPNADAELGNIQKKYEHFKSVVNDFDRFMIVDKWICDLITAEVAPDELWKYRPTIALGNMLLKNFGSINQTGRPGPRVDAILYPSIVTKLKSMNICMEPEVANAVFVPKLAWIIQYAGLDLKGDHYTARIKLISQTKGIHLNNTIEWGDVDPDGTREAFDSALTGRAELVFV